MSAPRCNTSAMSPEDKDYWVTLKATAEDTLKKLNDYKNHECGRVIADLSETNQKAIIRASKRGWRAILKQCNEQLKDVPL